MIRVFAFLLLAASAIAAPDGGYQRSPLTTNIANFASPVAGQGIVIHSVSGGLVVFTNETVAGGSGNPGGGNDQVQIKDGANFGGATGVVIPTGRTNLSASGELLSYRTWITNQLSVAGTIHTPNGFTTNGFPANTGVGSLVGLGRNNTNTGTYANVGGGSSNLNQVAGGFIGAGQFNRLITTGGTSNDFSAIGGGEFNVIDGGNTKHSGIFVGISNLIYNARYAGIFSAWDSEIRGGSNQFIGGGAKHTNHVQDSVIAGGYFNQIYSTNGPWGGVPAPRANFIGGGGGHFLIGSYSAIAGGLSNRMRTNGTGTLEGNFIGGGLENEVGGSYSSIVGGTVNLIGGNAGSSFIGGGTENKSLQELGFIGVGFQNTIALAAGHAGFIGNGFNNTISGGEFASILNGEGNTISAGNYSAILGGEGNTINATKAATVGSDNSVTGLGSFAFGNGNTVSGVGSIAIGYGHTVSADDTIQIGIDSSTAIVNNLAGTRFNGAVGEVPAATVTLTADNQEVFDPLNSSYIRIQSDNGTAGNRTFVLSPGSFSGQELTLEWIGANAGELVDDAALTSGGNIRLSATWTPTQYGTLDLQFNGTDWIEVSRSPITAAATPGGSTANVNYNSAGVLDGASGINVELSAGETNLNVTGHSRTFRLVVTNYADITQLWDGSTASKALAASISGTDPVFHFDNALTTLSNSALSLLGQLDVSGQSIFNDGIQVALQSTFLDALTVNGTFKSIGAATFGDGMTVTNGGRFVGTNNGLVRLNGTNTGWVEFMAPTAGQSNSLILDIAGPAAGNVLIAHSATVAAGTNVTTWTNVATVGSGSVVRTIGGSISDATVTNNLKYLWGADLAPSSQLTNVTADFAFASRQKPMTNHIHVSAVSNMPTDGTKPWTLTIRNFSGSTFTASLAPTIPRNGTNFVGVANGKSAVISIMPDGSGGANITNTVGTIVLYDSP